MALNWLISLHVLLFSVAQHKRHLAEKQCQIGDKVISTSEDFSDAGVGRDQSFYAMGTPRATTLIEEVYGPQERLHWKIKHIWSSSTIASWSAYALSIPLLYTRLAKSHPTANQNHSIPRFTYSLHLSN